MKFNNRIIMNRTTFNEMKIELKFKMSSICTYTDVRCYSLLVATLNASQIDIIYFLFGLNTENYFFE